MEPTYLSAGRIMRLRIEGLGEQGTADGGVWNGLCRVGGDGGRGDWRRAALVAKIDRVAQ
jgi:hypothetical protein